MAIEDFQKSFLETHNKYRADHGSNELTWSNELAKEAQAWADRVTKEKKTIEHSPLEMRLGQGENLALIQAGLNPSGEGNEATTIWYNEIKDYDFEAPTNDLIKTGHFSQVVWRGTSEVGAGISTFPDGRRCVVARYKRPGNRRGSYPKNVKSVGSARDEPKKEECLKRPRPKSVSYSFNFNYLSELQQKEHKQEQNCVGKMKTTQVKDKGSHKVRHPLFNAELCNGKTYVITHYRYLR